MRFIAKTKDIEGLDSQLFALQDGLTLARGTGLLEDIEIRVSSVTEVATTYTFDKVALRYIDKGVEKVAPVPSYLQSTGKPSANYFRFDLIYLSLEFNGLAVLTGEPLLNPAIPSTPENSIYVGVALIRGDGSGEIVTTSTQKTIYFGKGGHEMDWGYSPETRVLSPTRAVQMWFQNPTFNIVCLDAGVYQDNLDVTVANNEIRNNRHIYTNQDISLVTDSHPLSTKSLQFNGAGNPSAVSIPFKLNNVSTTLSIFFTYKGSLQTTNQLISSYGQASVGLGVLDFVRLASSNNLGIRYQDSGGVKTVVIPDIFNGYDNNWMTITALVEFQSRVINIYRNNMIYTSTEFETVPIYPSDTTPLRMGSMFNNGVYSEKLTGNISLYKIYNRLLSPDEVSDLNDGIFAETPDTIDYNISGATLPTVYDVSGYNIGSNRELQIFAPFATFKGNWILSGNSKITLNIKEHQGTIIRQDTGYLTLGPNIKIADLTIKDGTQLNVVNGFFDSLVVQDSATIICDHIRGGVLYEGDDTPDVSFKGRINDNHYPQVELISNKINNFSVVPSETKYPSEKLVVEKVLERTKYNSHGVIVMPTRTKNPDGTITISNDGSISFNEQEDGLGLTTKFNNIVGDTLTPTDGGTSFLYADYNSGAPIYKLTTDRNIFLTNATLSPVSRVTREGTKIHFAEYAEYGKVLSNQLMLKDIIVRGFERIEGLILSTVATRIPIVSVGKAVFGVQYFNLTENKVGTAGLLYEYYLVAGVWNNQPVNEYDATYFSDGTDRQTLGPNKWVSKYLFRDVGSDNEVYYIHGGEYSTEGQAYAEPIPVIPPILATHAIYVGKITIQKNATNGTAYPRTWGAGVINTAGVSVHSDLTGKEWTSAGHTGNNNTLAGFNNSGQAILVNKQYTIAFFNILLPCPILHIAAETLTLVKDTAINVVEYSTNNGSTWTVYSVPVAAAANSETLWRVASFNTGYDKGCLILNIS